MQSSQLSNKITDKVVQVVAPDVEDFEETTKVKVKYSANSFLRDLAHVVEYAGFAFFVALLFFTFKFNYGRYPIPIVMGCLACFLFALCDEFVQGCFDGRMTQISDVVMDMLGVAIGLVGACVVDLVGYCIIKSKSSKI